MHYRTNAQLAPDVLALAADTTVVQVDVSDPAAPTVVGHTAILPFAAMGRHGAWP